MYIVRMLNVPIYLIFDLFCFAFDVRLFILYSSSIVQYSTRTDIFNFFFNKYNLL